MSKFIIQQQGKSLGKEVKAKAIQKIDEEATKEGGKGNEKKKTRRSNSAKA